jgi:hypothetical protein
VPTLGDEAVDGGLPLLVRMKDRGAAHWPKSTDARGPCPSALGGAGPSSGEVLLLLVAIDCLRAVRDADKELRLFDVPTEATRRAAPGLRCRNGSGGLGVVPNTIDGGDEAGNVVWSE